MKKKMRDITNEEIQQYMPIINRVARKYTNNKEDFEDLKQELLIKELECFQSFDESREIPFDIFLNICCINKGKSYANKVYNKSLKILYMDDLEVELPEIKQELISEEAEDLFEYFKAHYREHKDANVVKLSYIDQYDTKAIAEKKGISRRAINKKIQNFNKWLKEKLEKDSYGI